MRKKLKTVKRTNKFAQYLSRFLVCVIFVLIGLIFLKKDPNLREKIYKNVFQNNLKFAKINRLYEKYFGSSLPLTGSTNLSLVSSEKLEYESLEEYKGGVKLKVKEDYAPFTLNSGIVIFAGDKEGYGKTVIVQSADETETWYSNLKEIKVSMYDYLNKGSIIGSVNKNELVLIFKKDGKELDYKKYL